MTSRVFSDYFTTWHEGMAMSRTAMAAVRAGYGVIPVRPGGKVPLCTLTPFQRSRDKGHACGVSHVITDDATAKRVFDRLADELGMQVNIGIVAAPSRLVVVDADTREAVSSFLGQWAQATNDSRYLEHSPTVSTPGSLVNGEWRHKDGGHWYFDVPEGIVLPEYPTQFRGADGYEVRWGNQMTVAPPSRRPEGPYIVNGDALEVPPWLLTLIQDHGARRIERIVDLADRFVNDGIVAWSLRQEWGRLLIVDGWDDTSKLDTCGCPIFEKPGGGTSSRKSATAHDAGCSAPIYANVEGHGALHLWTDDPPEPLAMWMTNTGKRTLTLFEYVTLTRYGGDETAAKIGEGIEFDFGTWAEGSGPSDSAPPPYTSESASECPQPQTQASDQDIPSSDHSAPDPDPSWFQATAKRLSERTEVPLPTVKHELGRELLRREIRTEIDQELGADGPRDGSTWLPRSDLLSTAKSPPVVNENNGMLERSDGATAFSAKGLHSLFGQSEAGKTFLMLTAIAQRARAGQRSLYCDFEDTMETFIGRFRNDLGIDPVPWIEAGLVCYASPTEPPSDITALMEAKFDLIVVDSLSEVVASIADGSMKDGALLRRVLRKFRQLADAGASVVVIAHGSEKVDVPTSSLGASEIRQALSGQELLLVNVHPFSNRAAGRSLIYIAKDRTSATGGDVDINNAAGHKTLKRLWGEMTVTPAPPDELEGITTWHTVIEVHPTTHAPDVIKVKKIDQAEVAIIEYLNLQSDNSARVADMYDDVSDENPELIERTLRRAVRRMLEDGLVHETGEASTATGGKPSPIIKLGPAPAPEEES